MTGSDLIRFLVKKQAQFQKRLLLYDQQVSGYKCLKFLRIFLFWNESQNWQILD